MSGRHSTKLRLNFERAMASFPHESPGTRRVYGALPYGRWALPSRGSPFVSLLQWGAKCSSHVVFYYVYCVPARPAGHLKSQHACDLFRAFWCGRGEASRRREIKRLGFRSCRRSGRRRQYSCPLLWQRSNFITLSTPSTYILPP